jgi:hypothetical protein
MTESGLRVTVNIPVASVGAGLRDGIAVSHFAPMTMKRRAVELRLIVDGKADEQPRIDPALLKALARARCCSRKWPRARSPRSLRSRVGEGLRKRYVTRLTKLAFMAPAIAEAIAAGRAPSGINLQMLMDGRLELTPCWFEQQRMFAGTQ